MKKLVTDLIERIYNDKVKFIADEGISATPKELKSYREDNDSIYMTIDAVFNNKDLSYSEKVIIPIEIKIRYISKKEAPFESMREFFILRELKNAIENYKGLNYLQSEFNPIKVLSISSFKGTFSVRKTYRAAKVYNLYDGECYFYLSMGELFYAFTEELLFKWDKDLLLKSLKKDKTLNYLFDTDKNVYSLRYKTSPKRNEYKSVYLLDFEDEIDLKEPITPTIPEFKRMKSFRYFYSKYIKEHEKEFLEWVKKQ